MATTASGLIVPAGSDPFDPQGDMVDLANSFRSRIRVPVANQTARDLLLSQIDWSPTGGQPLRVTRGDTAAHEHHDGIDWRTTWLPDATATFTVNGNWVVSGVPAIIRKGLTWYASITLTQKNAGAVSSGTTEMGTISTEARHTSGGVYYGAAKVVFPDGPSLSIYNRANGKVEMHMPAYTGSTSTVFLIALQWPAV